MEVCTKVKFMKEKSKVSESYKIKNKDMKAIGTKATKMEKVFYM